MPNVHINYLAVVAAAVLAFALGGVWYSPLLFAKQWVSAHGYTEEKVKEMQKSANKAYAIAVACQLLIALAIARLVGYLSLDKPGQGLELGLLAWGGFALPLGLMANVSSGKRLTVFCIDTGYQLIYLLMMGLIITVWR
ncbi:MAG TPA: DUF1761 domain-containing protein [Blastocatellia bacterium]|nr:DUF1761 domain-containing protein [Blastocatellia bacterium]